MRRRVILISLLLAAAPLAASAQADVPHVDVVEIAGVIDRPIARYLTERIEEAEQQRAALLVLQIDNLGGLKVSDDELLPPVVRRVRDARVPIAVWIGPRDARAGGLALFIARAADISSISPSATAGPIHPVDLGAIDRWTDESELEALAALARTTRVRADAGRVYRALESVEAGLADGIAVSVAQLLDQVDGRVVQTSAGEVTLRLPEDGVDIRFHQPGPIRRLLHTFSNASLVYIMLIAGAMLLVFELFQPGFGVAGVTAGLLFAAAGYGLTVLPVGGVGLVLLLGGLVLLGLDVALDRLGTATVAGAIALTVGSFLLLPREYEPLRIPAWVIVLAVVAGVVMFVPVMTMVRRARTPLATTVKRQLIGEPGQVRSLLNPEGFVLVADEIWRARSEDGSRLRVGEEVVVTGVEGTVVMVRSPVAGDPDPAAVRPGDGSS